MTEKSEKSTNRISWAWVETQPGWKGKEGKLIKFEEMSEPQLNKYYKLASHKELVYTNKASVFMDKRREIEEEAKRRGFDLSGLETAFHDNEKVLRK